MQILHIKHKAIDYQRWDNTVADSLIPLVYAFSWYLDIVSPGWEALVTPDYEYIMPLPTKTKYKIPYLTQPILTQQLGILSKKEINTEIVEEFINAIPYYSYEINLNENNFCHRAHEYPNFILSLRQNYEQLVSQFTKNNLRNIERARKQALSVKCCISAEEFMNLYFSVDKEYRMVKRTILEKILDHGKKNNSIKLMGVFSGNHELIAAACLLIASKRITYLLPVSNETGKKHSAMFLLIDEIIRNEAGKDVNLDFEGSKIDGVARFYKGFGAKNHPYYILKKWRPSFIVNKI